jgi:Protein of unknown function (DUF1553)/Protein of unknown function (DUF1549)/Planctomycete cytochrome C
LAIIYAGRVKVSNKDTKRITLKFEMQTLAASSPRLTHSSPMTRRTLEACWVVLMLAANLTAADEVQDRALAILRDHCLVCHAKAPSMSGLDLSTRESALKGGQRGPAIIPGRAADSRLYQAVRRNTALAMPPTKALAETDIDVLRQWIESGAPWAQQTASSTPASTWWASRKPVAPEVPRSDQAWVRNAIDEFVFKKLSENGLKPAPQASRPTLLRRLYYDLTGLPPSAAEVRDFVADQSPDAYSKRVDQLLGSPHYGEKWGRHWLDLVRYSDTAGFELDSYIADAWRYRDWVIQSFNNDKPYDRFIREQIAGDEFFPEDPVAQTGTGFFCVGPNRDLFPDQSDINREETLTDFVDTTSSVFLGLTAGCARCHDHKFDPISQRDYYRVQAVFAPFVKTKTPLDRLTSLSFETAENVREIKLREIGEQIRAVQGRCQKHLSEEKIKVLPVEVQEALRLEDSQRSARQRELVTQYNSRTRVSDDELRGCLTSEETTQLHAIEKRLVSMFAAYRAKPFACGITDIGYIAPKTYVPARGSRQREEVQPGFFAILGGGEVPPPAEKREGTGPIPLNPTTGRRRALADWIATPDNPLTGRVMVNRIWQDHFGRGIVATSSDFGTRGRLPSHPELLDWLATEFIARGWSVKHIHRIILNSATYQQDSVGTPSALEKDPENLLLARFSRRRLNADEIRDSTLAATGRLNRRAGGRPVVTPLSQEELKSLTQRPDDAWVVTADTTEYDRRSIYLLQKRTFRLPMMEVFDAPEPMVTCPRRESSTTAPQSLTLLNGAFVMEHSRALSGQLAAKYNSDAELIRAAWLQVLAREPDAEDLKLATRFLVKQTEIAGGRAAAVIEMVRGLLNLNEFLYVD